MKEVKPFDEDFDGDFEDFARRLANLLGEYDVADYVETNDRVLVGYIVETLKALRRTNLQMYGIRFGNRKKIQPKVRK